MTGFSDLEWYYALAVVVAAALAVYIVLYALLKIVATRTVWDWDDKAVAVIRVPLLFVLLFGITLFLLPTWSEFADDTRSSIQQAAAVLFTMSLCWMVIALADIAEELAYNKFASAGKVDAADENAAQLLEANDRMLRTRIYLLKRLAVFTLIFIAVISIMNTFDSLREIANYLLVYSALLGLAIGYAAKPVLENLIAALQIAFSTVIKIGDRVVIAGGSGTVEDITSTHCIVKLWNERRLVVPLSQVVQQSFENWTMTTTELTGTAAIWVDYSVPVAPLRAALEKAIQDRPKWDKRFVELLVTDTNSTNMELTLFVSARNASDRWYLQSWAREFLIDFVNNNYPSGLPRQRVDVAMKSERGDAPPLPDDHKQ